jgi:helicase
MHRADESASLGKGLAEVLDAIYTGNEKELADAAETLEELADKGKLSRANEPLALALAGLALDASGNTEKAKRPYFKLRDSSTPMTFQENAWPGALSRYLNDSIAYFGLRNFEALTPNATRAFETTRSLGPISREPGKDQDSLSISLILDLLLSYEDVVKSGATLDALKTKVSEMSQFLPELELSPWASIISSLAVKTIDAATKRSIFNFEISDPVRRRLVQRGMIELWPPQIEAVKNGVFKDRNLVYSTPAGTGKSFLAYASTGDSSPDAMTVYMVPTRTLAEESYAHLSRMLSGDKPNVAISTRERTEFDDHIEDYSVLVTTYEKFGALVRKSRIKETAIKRVIVDEVHTLSQEDRGIPLELTLTELKALKGGEDPQIITLSGMLRESDAKEFSDWLGASLVRSDWKPLEVDEQIVFPGGLIHKKGGEESVGITTNLSASFGAQREDLARKIILDIVTQKGQCMVAIESRKVSEDLAEKIASFFAQPSNLLLLGPALDGVRSGLNSIRKSVRESEPALTTSARKLTKYLQYGVAFHHAGLPRRFRQLIEKGIRDGHIKVVVTTTTFEAGVNLPISHVVFPFPMGRHNNIPMEVNTYRNLAGRAGRPGYDRLGTSILVALTKVEAEKYRERYFLSEGEQLNSALFALMRRRPEARSAVQAQLLDMTTRLKTTEDHFREFAQQTWFWRNSNHSERTIFEGHINTELRKLRVYGFITTNQAGEIEATPTGRIVNRSVLTPLSVTNLLDKTRKVVQSNKTGEEFDLLVLGLVAIPFEVKSNDDQVNDVKLDKSTAFLESIMTIDNRIYEKVQRTEMTRKYATVLRRWIDRLPIDEVLSECGLDPSSDAALLEELLPRDAYWVLSTIASFPKEAVRMSDAQRKRIRELGEYCKIGASDPLVIDLLNRGLKHMGRDTAIKIAGFLSKKGRKLETLEESELVSLFPDNEETARLLYTEISAPNSAT